LFASSYYRNDGNIHAAAEDLRQKVGQILGIEPDYYVLVNFEGFKNFIDFI